MSRLFRRVRRAKSIWLVAMAWFIVGAPRVATACSVCSAGRDEENQLAFLLSTVFMSALPLLAIGTLVFVVWKRFQKLEQESAAAESTPVPVPAPDF
jgi:hypothetical protein